MSVRFHIHQCSWPMLFAGFWASFVVRRCKQVQTVAQQRPPGCH